MFWEGHFTDCNGRGLLSSYSAIDPHRTAHPTLSSLDAELLHKAVEKAQLEDSRKGHFLRHATRRNSDVCTSSLVRTKVLKHKIFVTLAVSIKQKSYRVSPAKLKVTKELVEEMLAADIIKPPSSAWASPVVLIPKKDRKPRCELHQSKHNDLQRLFTLCPQHKKSWIRLLALWFSPPWTSTVATGQSQQGQNNL